MTTKRARGSSRAATRRRSATLGAATAAAVALVGLMTPAAHGASATTYYVDCSGTGSAGTLEQPFSSLAQVNEVELGPGDAVAFKRGVTCHGTFAPQGGWDAANPIDFGPYGDGTSRPVIDGAGAPDAIRIENLGGFVLHGLEVTNAAHVATAMADRPKARGVLVVANDYGGMLRGVTVRDMYVHDVWGDDTKDGNGSGGITVAVIGTAKASSFDAVLIEKNVVEHVDRTGITAVPSTWASRPEQGNYNPHRPFVKNTGIVIRDNTVSDTGGDGIVVQTGDGALVEGNTVDGFQRRSAGYNAGIWVWNSDGTVFRYNEASGGETQRDGMAFDVDQGSNNTLYEYNYSHDNEGGFFLLCNAEGRITNAVIRYNISQNDAFRGVETCKSTIDSAHIYNNTIYIGPGVSQTVINENTTAQRAIRFENNLVVKEGAGLADFQLRSGAITLASNVIYGVNGVAGNVGGKQVDPLLLDPGVATGRDDVDGYRLHVTSPALGAGGIVPDNGGRDYFGNPVAADAAPTVGAYGGDGVDGPVPPPLDVPVPAVTNGSFEQGTSGWSTSSAAAVAATGAPEGAQVIELTSAEGASASAEQTVSGFIVGQTYRLAGWARTDGGTAVIGIAGATTHDLTVETGEWTPVSVEFVAEQTSGTVFCSRETPGTSWCDDLRILAGPAVAPVVTSVVSPAPEASGWHLASPRVALEVVAPDQVHRTWYQLVPQVTGVESATQTGSITPQAWVEYQGPVAVPTGRYDLYAFAQDRTGVEGEPTLVTSVLVDTDAPTIEVAIDEARRTATIAADDVTSGVALVEYSLDGGATFLTSADPVALGQATGLEVRVTDVAGHAATGHWDIPAAAPSPTATPTATATTTATAAPTPSPTARPAGSIAATGTSAGVLIVVMGSLLGAGALAWRLAARRKRLT